MRRKIIMLYVIIVFLNLINPEFLSARDAPITSAGSSTLCPGVSAIVPVTVTNFTLIGAITLRLDFDPTKLTLDSITNLNPSISGASINSVIVNTTLTKILMVWASVNALTLPDSTQLFELNFTLMAGSPIISFNNTSGGGGDCEYADEDGMVMNDIPSATFYINSTITNLGVDAADTVTGIISLCAGTHDVAYSVPPITNATGYIWTVPTGGTIVSGDNTPSVVVNYSTSALSGILTVAGTNSCGTGALSSLPITIFPLPLPVINGVDTVCSGSTGNAYTTDSVMTNYSWSVSSGGIITAGAGTKTVTVDWNDAGTQNISVSYTNSNGCSAETPTLKAVTVNELPVPTITGPTMVCEGSTDNVYTTEAGMTGYLWNISTGGIVTGGGGIADTIITITWDTAGSQSVSVNYADGNGCYANTPASKSVTVSPLPGAAEAITGNASVCAGATEVSYQVPVIADANSYAWTVPAGATITGGSTTNSILVTFGSDPGSGIITVYGTNNCGSGVVSPSFNVMVNTIPDTPVIAADGALLTSSAASGNQWYNEVTGAIPGETGQTFMVFITGAYYTMVTLNDCVSPESNHVYVVIEGQQELENSNFSIYPGPNDGRLMVSITGVVREAFTIVVYNQIGAKVYELDDVQVNGKFEKQIDLRPVASGIYFVVVLNSAQTVVRKVLVR